MKPRSAKAKGRKLQDAIRDRILEAFPSLEPDDCKVAIMGESGCDIKLSPAARRLFPYSVEAKNQEKLNIWSALEQAEENCKDGTAPLLIFKRNRSRTYAVLALGDLLKLLT